MIGENNNEESITDLRISTLNISEAGPDTCQLTNNIDKFISHTPNKQPINVVAPLKSTDIRKMDLGGKLNVGKGVEGELELEMAKLHELLEKQELASQTKITELDGKLSRLMGQSCVLKERLKATEEREQAIAHRLRDQEESEQNLKTAMSEYQSLISKLTVDIENIRRTSKTKLNTLTEEKESALTHLNNVEAAFSDVHKKYEKCKKIMEDYKKNEAVIRETIGELEEKLKVREQQLLMVQTTSTQQADALHRELQRMQSEHDHEMTIVRAQLRKAEIKVISLQEALDQKVKENQELAVICDDLIAGKVSSTTQ